MSTLPENELDLEKLFLPAWAQQPSSAKLYAQYEGGDEPRERRGGPRGRRPERREGAPRGPRPPGERRDRGPRDERRGPPRREGDRRGGFGGERRSFDRRDPRDRREPREAPPPLPEINVNLLPDEKGVESLARQIRNTGRAYPLFDIARLILQKPERYAVRLGVKKKPDGTVAQPLFVCALDDTPWLSEDEAVAHVLNKHFATFYQAERTAIEPPKGTYTFVAQCGMSGVILGPPNHHDYQNQLRKLHTERFARMPFDAFKARVKIVKDEGVVKKWIEEQSFKTEYVVLNVPEPVRLPSLEEVGKHFRATHKEAIIKSVETHTVAGVPSRNLRCRELYRLVRTDWEQQRRFPLQLATELSRQLAAQGLQFFKVNKTVVHVSVARPLFLDLETTPVSDGIKRIVNFINNTPKCTRKKLIEALAPTPKSAEPAVAPAPETKSETTPTPTEPAALPVAEPTPEQTLVLVDLHWLIHAGAVLEFADGRMETAKKPLPRPTKPEKKPAEEKPATEGEAPSVTESVPQAEAEVETATEVPAPTETIAEPTAEEEKPPAQIPAPVEPATPAPEAAPSNEVSSPS